MKSGIGKFFLALIPWALGLGASVWLGVWIGVYHFRKELSQENRAATYVGATERPKSKIAVQIIPGGCLLVSRVDVDGGDLLIYWKNTCGFRLDYAELHYEAISPDGTILSQWYDNGSQCSFPTFSGDTAECRTTVRDDDRVAKLRVWAGRQNNWGQR